MESSTTAGEEESAKVEVGASVVACNKRGRRSSLDDISCLLASLASIQANIGSNEAAQDDDRVLQSTNTAQDFTYVAEKNLSHSTELERDRLAKRVATTDFPMDACLTALQKSKHDLRRTFQLLLQWYPRGEGGRTMIKNLLEAIEAAEEKLAEVRAALKATFASGTVAERLALLQEKFDTLRGECLDSEHIDNGEDDYLTPEEFGRLTHSLGVDLTTEELEEIILKLDENGDGEIQFDEMLMWWDEPAVTELYESLQQNSGGDSCDDGASTKEERVHLLSSTERVRRASTWLKNLGLSLEPMQHGHDPRLPWSPPLSNQQAGQGGEAAGSSPSAQRTRRHTFTGFESGSPPSRTSTYLLSAPAPKPALVGGAEPWSSKHLPPCPSARRIEANIEQFNSMPIQKRNSAEDIARVVTDIGVARYSRERFQRRRSISDLRSDAVAIAVARRRESKNRFPSGEIASQ